MTSMLDNIYSALANRERFFQDGWGDIPGLTYIMDKDPTSLHMRPVDDVHVQWEHERRHKHYILREGWFETNFEFVYELEGETTAVYLPEEARRAHIQMILPRATGEKSPLTLHFAATGDEGFDRRQFFMARPLAKAGIGSVLLENPFYGSRRPSDQKGAAVREFTGFLRMSRAATDEGVALLRYLQKEGYGPLGVTGVSMGGYVSMTAAARSGLDLAVAACIPCHSAAPVYVGGALGRACDWDKLQDELGADLDAREYMKEILSLSDIRTFPRPARPEAAIIVGARKDAYIPNYSTEICQAHWPGSSLRWVNSGHVGSFIFATRAFRQAVVDSFDLLALSLDNHPPENGASSKNEAKGANESVKKKTSRKKTAKKVTKKVAKKVAKKVVKKTGRKAAKKNGKKVLKKGTNQSARKAGVAAR